MTIAITRAVSPRLGECELTHLERVPINAARAERQHAVYEDALAVLGCTVVHAGPAPDLPDAVFVEDTTVVLDQCAVITRPGAESRRAETDSVAQVLETLTELRRITAPATLDGGDVLVAGRRIFVGVSTRTNAAGVEQLEAIARPAGYSVVPVDVNGCLHLKSAVTCIAPDMLLLNPAWVDRDVFAGYDVVEADPAEPFAANALALPRGLIYPLAWRRTAARLEARGLHIHAVDISELVKAEGAVTCCSIIVHDGAAGGNIV